MYLFMYLLYRMHVHMHMHKINMQNPILNDELLLCVSMDLVTHYTQCLNILGVSDAFS